MTQSAIFQSVCSQDGTWHVEPHTKRAMAAFVKASMRGSAVEIVIRKKRKARTDKQNRYYWGVVIAEIASCAGYRKADSYQLHDALAFKFLSYQLHDALAFKFLALPNCPITGSPRRQRTPETGTEEFGVYLEQVIQWAAETWGVVIPEASSVEPPYSTEGRSPRQVDREQGLGV